MYEEYYGFAQPPFNLTPDPRFLYRSASHAVALQQVLQAIQRREGFVVLTGDIGTGKTMLCRALLQQTNPTTFTALILNPFLSVEELLREVLLGFGVASRETIRSGRLATATKHELVRTLHDFLHTLAPLGASALVVMDEAQHLSPDVLEEIRILLNLDLADQRLLQILIVGQLNLLEVLERAELRQFNQRISLRCSLQPLEPHEVDAYVSHRLSVARGARPVQFTAEAVRVVHEMTGGIPRLINLLCDRTLMAGAEARTDTIGPELVTKAANVLGLPEKRIDPPLVPVLPQPQRRTMFAAAALVLALAGLLGYAVGYRMGGEGGVATTMTSPPNSTAPNSIAPSSTAPTGAAPIGTPPAAVPTEPPAPVQTATAPAPRVRGPVPPTSAGPFSILIGTYADPNELATIERRLLDADLPVYAIDVTFPPADVRGRLLVGRYRTQREARAAQVALSSTVPDAIVILGWQERLRRMGQGRPVPYPEPEPEQD